MYFSRRCLMLAALLVDRVDAAGCPDDPEVDLCGSGSDDETQQASGGMRAGSFALWLPGALGGAKLQTMVLLPLVSLQMASAADIDFSKETKDMKCSAFKDAYKEAGCCGKPTESSKMTVIPAHDGGLFKGKTNPCSGKKPTGTAWDNKMCLEGEVIKAFEQSGTDVSMNYKGTLDASPEGGNVSYLSRAPITDAYFTKKMCPVNVHWHLGAEHRSTGEYDETFFEKGPAGGHGAKRRLAGENANEGMRPGFRCKHYDSTDAKFTTKYEFKHCLNMSVGETYEVHWPHSAAGMCGTPWQYQSPFYNGVFCVDAAVNMVVAEVGKKNYNAVSQHIGVQGQVFTIVNDEKYFYPELFRGWIKDGEMAKHITSYTGSTTGTSRNNKICSQYAPITWQVDRKCHLISASSFDKMCADMKAQAADMRSDLMPHGARELVLSKFAADNHQGNTRRLAEEEEEESQLVEGMVFA